MDNSSTADYEVSVGNKSSNRKTISAKKSREGLYRGRDYPSFKVTSVSIGLNNGKETKLILSPSVRSKYFKVTNRAIIQKEKKKMKVTFADQVKNFEISKEKEPTQTIKINHFNTLNKAVLNQNKNIKSRNKQQYDLLSQKEHTQCSSCIVY